MDVMPLNELKERIYAEINRYWNEHNVPYRIHFLASKFGKRLKAHNLQLIDVLLNDSRYVCKQHPKTGGWFVVPTNGFEEYFEGDEPDMIDTLKSNVWKSWMNIGLGG